MSTKSNPTKKEIRRFKRRLVVEPVGAQLRSGNTAQKFLLPCQIWTGALDNKGYGVLRLHPGALGCASGLVRAHRVAYWIACGPFPIHAQVDHTCRRTRCCEPTHLQLLGHREHSRLSRADQLGDWANEDIL